MTKNILILVSLFMYSAYGMKRNALEETGSLLELTKKKFITPYYGTDIIVIKGSLLDLSDKLTIVENNIEVKSNAPILGVVSFPCNPTKFNVSECDDDAYKPYYPSDVSNFHIAKAIDEYTDIQLNNYEKVICSSRITKITSRTKVNQNYYPKTQERTHQSYVLKLQPNIFTPETDAESDSQNLALCYTNVLTFPIEHGNLSDYIKDGTKAVADFQFLYTDSTRDKAADVIIKTILEWLKKNSNIYETIRFHIQNDLNFARFKLLLLQHSGSLHKICLIYFAHNDKNGENILCCLPKDIIHYMVKLI